MSVASRISNSISRSWFLCIMCALVMSSERREVTITDVDFTSPSLQLRHKRARTLLRRSYHRAVAGKKVYPRIRECVEIALKAMINGSQEEKAVLTDIIAATTQQDCNDAIRRARQTFLNDELLIQYMDVAREIASGY